MRIKQGIVLIKFNDGSKKWWRVSRQDIYKLKDNILKVQDMHYAKIFNFKRGKSKGTGTVQEQIAFIYFKNGSWQLVLV